MVSATVKALGVNEATEWIEREKNALIKLGTVTGKVYNEMVEQGIEFAEFIRDNSHANMHILCKMKISEVLDMVNGRGVSYLNCESVLP